MPKILARRQLIALISILLIAVTVGTVAADEGIMDSAGQETIEASTQAAPQAIALSDDLRSTFYPAFAFRPRTTDATTVTADTSRGCAWTSSSSLLVTEVLLPAGAVVEEVTLFANDTDAANVTLYLTSFTLPASAGGLPSFSDIFVASSSAATGFQVVSDTTPSQLGREVIDTTSSSYALQVRAPSSTRQLCGARVVWRIPDPGLVLHPVAPCRIFDSRPGKGGREAPIGAFRKARFDALRDDYSSLGGSSSDCNLPPDAQGLHLAVNVLNATKGGGIKIWPKGGPFSPAPSLIFDNQGRASSAVPVVIGDDDKIVVKNESKGKTHIQLIVLGWYGPPKS